MACRVAELDTKYWNNNMYSIYKWDTHGALKTNGYYHFAYQENEEDDENTFEINIVSTDTNEYFIEQVEFFLTNSELVFNKDNFGYNKVYLFDDLRECQIALCKVVANALNKEITYVFNYFKKNEYI